MNYQKLSNDTLEKLAQKTIREERKLQIEILHMLAEIEHRRLYSKNYSSLFDYCVKALELPAASAQARIYTMRAMKLIPEIEEKLVNNELNLTTVALAQTFFNQEKKAGKFYSTDEKRQVLQKFENKSGRECRLELLKISPESVPQETRRQVTEDKTEIKIVADQNLIAMLDQIKNLYSHTNPTMTDDELLKMLALDFLKKNDPVQNQKKTRKSISSNEVNPRHIPARIKREVWLRDGGKCTYPDCNSQHQLEYDHIRPIAMGGKSTADNLRLLCKTHNQRAAIDLLGFKKMNIYINKKPTPS